MQNSKIKILHVTYDMNIGGTEQVIRNLVEGLDPNKFSSEILCIEGSIGPWGKELENKGYPHHALKRKPGFDLSLIFEIRKLLKKREIDIVHCHQYTPYTYGFFGAIFTSRPTIFTEHGRFYPDFSSPKRKFINPFMQSLTASITAISEATKQALVKYEFLKQSRIKVIYNGIADLSKTLNDEKLKNLRSTLEIAPDEIVFGTISRLDPIKNQTMMIQAFAKALSTTPNIKLLIVGDGPLREQLELLTKQLNLSTNVIFTGFQSNPQYYLSIMDVFLLPSLSEGTSMTLLEAMSFSKPTIATAVGGTPEIIDNETGLLIENENQKELENAIVKLTLSQSERMKLGESARKSYLQRFTLEAMTKQYELLYLEQHVHHR